MQSENKTRQMIYKIVDENYGDRITDFSVDSIPQAGAVASGNFSTPRFGGKNLIIDYAIKDTDITLTPRNLEIIDHDEEKFCKILESLFIYAENLKYAPLELYQFAAAAKCGKGWTCGKACLSKTKKNCHQALTQEHKTYVSWLKSQIEKGAALHQGHRDEAEKLGLTKEPPQEQPKEPPKAKPKNRKQRRQSPPKASPLPTQSRIPKDVAKKYNDLIKILGDTLKVEDFDNEIVQIHVADLHLVPSHLLAKTKRHGLEEICFAAKTIPDMDSNQHLRGITPRGYEGSGKTWDDVPGGFNNLHRAVCAGVGEHGCISLALHEYFHGVGSVLNFDNHPELIKIHKDIYDSLDPYHQQGGKGGFAGRQEFFADGAAAVVKNKGYAVRRYGQDFVDFIENNVLKEKP